MNLVELVELKKKRNEMYGRLRELARQRKALKDAGKSTAEIDKKLAEVQKEYQEAKANYLSAFREKYGKDAIEKINVPLRLSARQDSKFKYTTKEGALAVIKAVRKFVKPLLDELSLLETFDKEKVKEVYKKVRKKFLMNEREILNRAKKVGKLEAEKEKLLAKVRQIEEKKKLLS